MKRFIAATKYILSAIVLVAGVFFLSPLWHAYGNDMTSSSFIIRDPTVGTGGGYGTSSSFAAYTSFQPTESGHASSTSYGGRFGFLWFPYVKQGSFTATPGASQVDLAWGASQAGLGWTVTGYSTGIATVSGGPYTYTNVGNVTSYSYTGLTPGTYCFVLRTLDAFNNTIATSPEQCATIVPTLSFAISDSAVGFGTLSSTGARYATTTGGSSSNTADAHTITASSNATGGYTISYRGALPTSGANTIAAASGITGAGTAGTPQFGLSLSTTGSATITSGYQQSVPSWSYVANTTTPVASTSGVTSSETYGVRYIANIAPSTPAGNYATSVDYAITANF